MNLNQPSSLDIRKWAAKTFLVKDPSIIPAHSWAELIPKYDGILILVDNSETLDPRLRSSYYERKIKNIFTGGRSKYAPRRYIFLLFSEILRGNIRQGNILAEMQNINNIYPRPVWIFPKNITWPQSQ